MRYLTIGTIPLSVLFVLLWSSGWIGSKFGLGYAGTFSLLMWRYMFVVATLLVLVSLFNSWCSINRGEIFSHALVGILSNAVYLLTSLTPMNLGVSVGVVAFVLALQPLLTAGISARFTGENVDTRQWIGLVLGLIAVSLVVGDRIAVGGSLFAYFLLLLATIAITFATVINRRREIASKRTKKPNTPILLMLLIHCSASLLLFIPLAGYFEGFNAIWEPPLFFSILWLGWVVTLGAYGLLFVLLRRLSATKVSCLMYLSPPTTMLIAYFAFGERLATVDVIGLLIAGIAVWIVSTPQLITEDRKKTATAKASLAD